MCIRDRYRNCVLWIWESDIAICRAEELQWTQAEKCERNRQGILYDADWTFCHQIEMCVKFGKCGPIWFWKSNLWEAPNISGSLYKLYYRYQNFQRKEKDVWRRVGERMIVKRSNSSTKTAPLHIRRNRRSAYLQRIIKCRIDSERGDGKNVMERLSER